MKRVLNSSEVVTVVATEPDNSSDPNTIATYLADLIIKSSAVKEAGGGHEILESSKGAPTLYIQDGS